MPAALSNCHLRKPHPGTPGYLCQLFSFCPKPEPVPGVSFPFILLSSRCQGETSQDLGSSPASSHRFPGTKSSPASCPKPWSLNPVLWDRICARQCSGHNTLQVESRDRKHACLISLPPTNTENNLFHWTDGLLKVLEGHK